MVYRRNITHSGSASHLGSFLTGCVAGAILGGVLGVLLAPHRGDITRRKVARKAGETKDQVVEAVEDRLENLKAQKEERNGDEDTDS